MLEDYFVPKTTDRIRESWIAPQIERHVAWLQERRYARSSVHNRVPLLVRFGEFARGRGARNPPELAAHIDAFVAIRSQEHRRSAAAIRKGATLGQAIRAQVEQFVASVAPGFKPTTYWPPLPWPFLDRAPGFQAYLHDERGLRPATVRQYAHHLRKLESYLDEIHVRSLRRLSPSILRDFVVRIAHGLGPASVDECCGLLKVFLRYIHREQLIPTDLSVAVGRPRTYRLAGLPRSISWPQVAEVLAGVDRRDAAGLRDYAILVLLVTYGLRASEVAALRLDDIDWKHGQLRIPERKAKHSAHLPLSTTVGNAIAAYLEKGRPPAVGRQLFLRTTAPFSPITTTVVSHRAGFFVKKAGIVVRRPGSHTLRHACVQRLVDLDIPLQMIGDYVGHRSPESTQVYGKIAIKSLRDVALGLDGELP